jgi:hypothetical protein
MADPFQFCSSAKLVELTGRRARTVPELAEGIRALDDTVLFHHTHHFLLQHQYWLPEPTSDFAWWVAEILQERALGEDLASINTVEYRSIQELKSRILAVIAAHEGSRTRTVEAPSGLEFHFLRTHSYVFPTDHRASTLAEFAGHLERVSLQSIYHHVFEARLRLARPTNDFAWWFRDSLGEKQLAESVEHLDPYVFTLEDLRARILQLVKRRL